MFGSLFSSGLVEAAWRRKVETAGYRVIEGMWVITESTKDSPGRCVVEDKSTVKYEKYTYETD
jgi:hypothetical protein